MNNIEFIRNWFLENNPYLKEDSNKDEILNILIMNVVAFGTLEEIFSNESIIINNNIVFFNSSLYKENNELLNILKLVNHVYGYLNLDDLIKKDAYYHIVFDSLNKTLTKEDIEYYFGDIYYNLKNIYYNYDFSKLAYKINDKTFFSNEKLTKEDVEILFKIDNPEQKLFEVKRNKDNSLEVY